VSSEHRGGVYKITCGDWVYYGRTVDFSRRKHKHFRQLQRGVHHNDILQRAFDAHGEESFVFEVVRACDYKHAIELETSILQVVRSCVESSGRHGFANLRYEDGTSMQLSSESREKISAKAKGRPMPESAKRLLSEARKGVPRTPEAVQKMAEGRRGIKLSQETRRRMSESRTGKRHRASAKAAIMAANRRPILVVNSDMESLYFLSTNDVALALGINPTYLSPIISGKKPVPKRFAGYRFSRLDRTKENWSIFPTASSHEHA
jgi:group I intron endonuclease